MLPLRSFLSPDQPNHTDRGNNNHTFQKPGVDEVCEAGQRDDCLPQSHIQPQHRVRVGALEVHSLLLVVMEKVRCQHPITIMSTIALPSATLSITNTFTFCCRSR